MYYFIIYMINLIVPSCGHTQFLHAIGVGIHNLRCHWSLSSFPSGALTLSCCRFTVFWGLASVNILRLGEVPLVFLFFLATFSHAQLSASSYGAVDVSVLYHFFLTTHLPITVDISMPMLQPIMFFASRSSWVTGSTVSTSLALVDDNQM